ncbi:MAG: transposase [Lacunisphaera sp.]
MSDIPNRPRIPSRNHPAHLPLAARSNRSVIIYLTVCTKNRHRILASPEIHRLLVNAWQSAVRWRIGRYVIMPDHLHLFCSPGTHPPTPLANWIRFWKSSVTKAAGYQEGEFWQRDHWDTQLRRSESYAAKWEYVRNNPVRADLVVNSDDWPYQGEIRELRWHM